MKIECSNKKLKYFISLADKITSKNSTLPILDSILLIAENNILKIRSTNLDIGIEFEIPLINIKEPGKIAVPGYILNNILSTLQTEKTILISTINNNLNLSTKNNSIIIQSKQTEDFPTIPKINTGDIFKVNSKKFTNGIKSVIYSSSISDIKPEISSIYIYNDNNTLIFTATDLFRLAEKKIQHKNTNNINGIIIPFRNANEIIKIFEDVDCDINIRFNKNQIVFYCDNIYLTSRLIDGIFPDYKQIIPKDILTEVIVLKQDFINTLKITNIFTDKFNKVNFIIDIKNNIFEVNSKNDLGENKTNINSTLSGDNISISLNSKYIVDCFQSISSDSILLQFAGENKPVIIKGVGDGSFIYLIMPINK